MSARPWSGKRRDRMTNDMEKGDAYIMDLTPELSKSWEEIGRKAGDIVEALRRLNDRREVVTARKWLFWKACEDASERAESAGSRGLVIGVRRRDGKHVLVERKEIGNPLKSLVDLIRDLTGHGDD